MEKRNHVCERMGERKDSERPTYRRDRASENANQTSDACLRDGCVSTFIHIAEIINQSLDICLTERHLYNDVNSLHMLSSVVLFESKSGGICFLFGL